MVTVNFDSSLFFETENGLTEYNRVKIHTWMDQPFIQLRAEIEFFWVVVDQTEEGPVEQETSAGTPYSIIEVMNSGNYDENWTDQSASEVLKEVLENI